MIIIFKYRSQNKTQIPLGICNLSYKLIHPSICLLIRKKKRLLAEKVKVYQYKFIPLMSYSKSNIDTVLCVNSPYYLESGSI